MLAMNTTMAASGHMPWCSRKHHAAENGVRLGLPSEVTAMTGNRLAGT
jgi:hypothetical protein